MEHAHVSPHRVFVAYDPRVDHSRCTTITTAFFMREKLAEDGATGVQRVFIAPGSHTAIVTLHSDDDVRRMLDLDDVLYRRHGWSVRPVSFNTVVDPVVLPAPTTPPRRAPPPPRPPSPTTNVLAALQIIAAAGVPTAPTAPCAQRRQVPVLTLLDGSSEHAWMSVVTTALHGCGGVDVCPHAAPADSQRAFVAVASRVLEQGLVYGVYVHPGDPRHAHLYAPSCVHTASGWCPEPLDAYALVRTVDELEAMRTRRRREARMAAHATPSS